MLNMLFKPLICIIIYGIINFHVYAEEKEQNIKQPHIFTIGVENTKKLPLYNVNENGEFSGLYRNILDKFAADNNIKFIYQPYKINKLFKFLLNEKVDFKFPDNPTWRAADKRSYNIIYSEPIYFYIEALFIKPSFIGKTIDQFNSIGLVGDVALWSIHHFIEINKIKIKRDNCKKLIKQLLNSEIEGILCNYFVMQKSLRELGLTEKIIPNFDLPHIDDDYYLSTINHPDIIQDFNNWLNNYKEDINKCHQKYLYNKNPKVKQNKCIFE